MTEENWSKAKVTLKKVKMLYPEYVGPDNAYLLLATVYRRHCRNRGRAGDPRGAGDEGWRRESGLSCG